VGVLGRPSVEEVRVRVRLYTGDMGVSYCGGVIIGKNQTSLRRGSTSQAQNQGNPGECGPGEPTLAEA
jgi:hypothetical protein